MPPMPNPKDLTRWAGAARAVWLAAMLALPTPALAATRDAAGAAGAAEDAGVKALQRGRAEDTMRLWQQALDLYEAAGDVRAQARTLLNMGTLAGALGRKDGVTDLLGRSRDLARRIGDRGIQTDALVKLGAANRVAKPVEAARAYEEALALAPDDARVQVEAESGLGQVRADAGQVDAAAGHYRRALDRAIAAGLRDAEAVNAYRLGRLLFDRGDAVGAMPLLERAAELSAALGNRRNQALALGDLGQAAYLLGDHAQAVARQKESLRAAQDANDVHLQRKAQTHLGNAYYYMDDFGHAEAAYRSAMEISERMGDRRQAARDAGNLALVLTKRKEFAEAETLHRRDLESVRETHDALAEAQTLGNLGALALQREDYQGALDWLGQSREVARRIGYPRGEAIVLTNAAIAQLELGRPVEAEATAREALAAADAVRARTTGSDRYDITMFEREQQAFRLLQGALVAQGRPEEALEVAETGRARPFADALARRRSDPAVARAPGVAAIRAVARREGATLVEYSGADEAGAFYVWVVRPDGHIAFRETINTQKGSAKGLFVEMTQEMLSEIGPLPYGPKTTIAAPGAPPPPISALRVLGMLLIDPIADLLPADPAAPVVFMPQGALFRVPFAALTLRDGRALIEAHTIATASSIRALDLMGRADVAAAGPALVVGNPEPMPSVAPRPGANPVPLLPLPGAEAEAKQIASLTGAQLLVGPAATKAAAVAAMRGARLIHVASHGLLDEVERDGTKGALAFAPEAGDDGLLRSAEIAKLSLSADLVVLSACDSGRGDVTGDGVVGLQRAFLIAGARSAVVSLWSVRDASTAELMAAFYRHLATEPTKARALRAAMLETRASHPSPRDWAGFTMVGGVR